MENYNSSDQAYVIPLIRMIKSGVSSEKMIEWYALRGANYSNTLIKRTLKMSGREDLIPYMIEESDIEIGNTVKSRSTGRIGTVKKIHTDGDTVTVKWESGGIQPISKESLYIVSNSGKIENRDDITKVHTQGDEYRGMDTHKQIRTQRDINKE